MNAIVTLWSDIENEKRAFSLRAWSLPRRSMCLLAAHWMLIFMQFYHKKKNNESAQQQKVVQFCIVYLLRKASIFFLNTFLDNSVVFDYKFVYLFRVRSFISPYPCRSFSDQRKQCTRFIGDDTVLCVIVCTCPDV